MLRIVTLLFVVLAAAPARAEGPPHDPRLERVAWEMAQTERSPRVLGWSVEIVGGDTIVLGQSWPEGYRVELTAEGGLSASNFFASDNVSHRMAATLEHPGGACSVAMGKNSDRERAQMMVMPMGDDSVAGNVTLTLRCYGSGHPLGIQLSIVPTP